MRTTYIAGSRDDLLGRTTATQCAPAGWPSAAACWRSAATARIRDVPSFESHHLEDDMRWMLERLRAVGIHQVIAVDLTRSWAYRSRV